jgi:hypothetical protein
LPTCRVLVGDDEVQIADEPRWAVNSMFSRFVTGVEFRCVCRTQRGSVGSLLALGVAHIPGFRCTPAGDGPAPYLVNVESSF